MSQIANDAEFGKVLEGLDPIPRRLLAARFVEDVLALCSDARVIQIAANADASEDELVEALQTARAVTFDCHTRCGSEGDWLKQAGYFVARAATFALTPVEEVPGGPAWQAALSCRMALTSRAIVTGDDTAGEESKQQYRILSEFLES